MVRWIRDPHNLFVSEAILYAGGIYGVIHLVAVVSAARFARGGCRLRRIAVLQ